MENQYSKRSLRMYRSSVVSYNPEELNSDTKRKIFEWLYHPKFDIFVFILVLLSIFMLLLELSHPDHKHNAGWMGQIAGKETNPTFLQIDIVITFIFLLEYSVKFWIAPRKLTFFTHNLIELLSLLPILRVFRMIRVIRIVRLIRLVRINNIVHQNLGFKEDETSDLVTVLMYLFFSIIFGTIGIMVFERGENDGFQYLMDGFWWCIVTITTVGYGDISPITTPGKIVAVCIMFIGLAFYASLTGVISETLITRSREKKKRRLEEYMFSKHIILCGWNRHADLICEQVLEDREQLILVLSTIDQTNSANSAQLFHKASDPTLKKSLLDANLMEATALVLLADERLDQDTDRDARNILISMNARSLRKDIPIIFQLENEEHRSHLETIGVEKVLHISKLASKALQNMLST